MSYKKNRKFQTQSHKTHFPNKSTVANPMIHAKLAQRPDAADNMCAVVPYIPSLSLSIYIYAYAYIYRERCVYMNIYIYMQV